MVSSVRAARSQDYVELKKAQDRSDIRKTFFGEGAGEEEEERSKVSVEFLVQLVNFLLSERGSFLKEALVNELVRHTHSHRTPQTTYHQDKSHGSS